MKNDRAHIIGDLEVGGERGRVFHNDGICGTLSATEWKDPTKVLVVHGSKASRKFEQADKEG